MAFDYEKMGYMATSDLKNALEHLGEKVDEQETFLMIATADPENTGTIQYNQFKELIEEKRESEGGSTEEELLEAFVAMGGQPDGDGFIDADKLIHTIKNEFEMTIDIENLILEIDEDGSGEIEFDEFKELLAGGG
jgi:Ca2+-binding EF-hand superfamily protein